MTFKTFIFLTNKKKHLFTLIFFSIAILAISLFHTVDKTTNTMIVSFIEEIGWKIKSKPVEIKKFFIPEKFDEVYSVYNQIQKLSNFDLEPYKGKRATRYSYIILNHIETHSETRANIIISDGKIIAADISQNGKNGFIHKITEKTKIKK